MRFAKAFNLVTVAAGVLAIAGTARAVSINIPNGSFETDADNSSWAAGGAHPTNWNTQFTFGPPSYFQGPSYGIQTSTSFPGQAAEDGTKFAALWPGEMFSSANAPVVPTAMNTTFTMASTGITDTTLAGDTYTATIAVGLPHTHGVNQYASPSFTVSILDNGVVKASNSIASGSVAGGVWYDLSSLPYVPSASGDSLQVQVTMSGFYEGPGQYNETFAMVDNARLSYTAVPEPGSCVLLAVGLVGLLGTFRRFRRA